MVLKAESQGEKRLDWIKWLIAFILLLAAVVGNYYYSQVSMPLRMVAWSVMIAVAGFVASKTQKGKWVVEFFRDSRLELRKVIWPTRQETMQTTMVVAAMAIILALMLWGVDGVLVWLIGSLTGQRG